MRVRPRPGLRRRGAPIPPATLPHSPPMWRPPMRLVSPPHLGSGTGWAGVIQCGQPLACRWRLPSGRRVFAPFSRVRMRWTNTSAPRGWSRTCRCGWRCWTCGTATSMASPAVRLHRTTAPCAVCLRICSNWRWRATANGWMPAGRHCRLGPHRCYGVNPAPTGSMPIFRCCTRARILCRWSLWR